jgi:hypothetical protein
MRKGMMVLAVVLFLGSAALEAAVCCTAGNGAKCCGPRQCGADPTGCWAI